MKKLLKKTTAPISALALLLLLAGTVQLSINTAWAQDEEEEVILEDTSDTSVIDESGEAYEGSPSSDE